MWAVGVIELGLASDEVWNLTPAQFVALDRQHNQQVERADLRAGIVAAQIDVIIAGLSKESRKPRNAFEMVGRRTPERKILPGEMELRARIAQACTKRMRGVTVGN